jgi:hypothetical protein
MEYPFFLSEYKGRRGLNPDDLAINLKYFHKSDLLTLFVNIINLM